MALKIDASSEIAYQNNPWSGDSFTIAFWFRRTVTTVRFLAGLIDTDDATPETSGDPTAKISTSSGSLVAASYTGAGGSTSKTSTDTYTDSAWNHVAAVFSASGTTMSSVQVFVNGVDQGTTSASRAMSTNGTFDRLQIGIVSASHSNADIAYFSYYASALSGSQVTELQTKLPNAITGATPSIYESFVGGSGGSFTLSGATIDSTNDGTLPALSSGGGSGVRSRALLMGIG